MWCIENKWKMVATIYKMGNFQKFSEGVERRDYQNNEQISEVKIKWEGKIWLKKK
jgi:hypothetical protein